MLGDSLEGHQETLEICITIELFDFGERSGLPVAMLKFEQGSCINSALEVQMQLGLGEEADEAVGPVGRRGHSSDCRLWIAYLRESKLTAHRLTELTGRSRASNGGETLEGGCGWRYFFPNSLRWRL